VESGGSSRSPVAEPTHYVQQSTTHKSPTRKATDIIQQRRGKSAVQTQEVPKSQEVPQSQEVAPPRRRSPTRKAMDLGKSLVREMVPGFSCSSNYTYEEPVRSAYEEPVRSVPVLPVPEEPVRSVPRRRPPPVDDSASVREKQIRWAAARKRMKEETAAAKLDPEVDDWHAEESTPWWEVEKKQIEEVLLSKERRMQMDHDAAQKSVPPTGSRAKYHVESSDDGNGSEAYGDDDYAGVSHWDAPSRTSGGSSESGASHDEFLRMDADRWTEDEGEGAGLHATPPPRTSHHPPPSRLVEDDRDSRSYSHLHHRSPLQKMTANTVSSVETENTSMWSKPAAVPDNNTDGWTIGPTDSLGRWTTAPDSTSQLTATPTESTSRWTTAPTETTGGLTAGGLTASSTDVSSLTQPTVAHTAGTGQSSVNSSTFFPDVNYQYLEEEHLAPLVPKEPEPKDKDRLAATARRTRQGRKGAHTEAAPLPWRQVNAAQSTADDIWGKLEVAAPTDVWGEVIDPLPQPDDIDMPALRQSSSAAKNRSRLAAAAARPRASADVATVAEKAATLQVVSNGQNNSNEFRLEAKDILTHLASPVNIVTSSSKDWGVTPNQVTTVAAVAEELVTQTESEYETNSSSEEEATSEEEETTSSEEEAGDGDENLAENTTTPNTSLEYRQGDNKTLGISQQSPILARLDASANGTLNISVGDKWNSIKEEEHVEEGGDDSDDGSASRQSSSKKLGRSVVDELLMTSSDDSSNPSSHRHVAAISNGPPPSPIRSGKDSSSAELDFGSDGKSIFDLKSDHTSGTFSTRRAHRRKVIEEGLAKKKRRPAALVDGNPVLLADRSERSDSEDSIADKGKTSHKFKGEKSPRAQRPRRRNSPQNRALVNKTSLEKVYKKENSDHSHSSGNVPSRRRRSRSAELRQNNEDVIKESPKQQERKKDADLVDPVDQSMDSQVEDLLKDLFLNEDTINLKMDGLKKIRSTISDKAIRRRSRRRSRGRRMSGSDNSESSRSFAGKENRGRSSDSLDRRKDRKDRSKDNRGRSRDSLDRRKNRKDRSKDSRGGSRDSLDRRKDRVDRKRTLPADKQKTLNIQKNSLPSPLVTKDDLVDDEDNGGNSTGDDSNSDSQRSYMSGTTGVTGITGTTGLSNDRGDRTGDDSDSMMTGVTGILGNEGNNKSAKVNRKPRNTGRDASIVTVNETSYVSNIYEKIQVTVESSTQALMKGMSSPVDIGADDPFFSSLVEHTEDPCGNANSGLPSLECTKRSLDNWVDYATNVLFPGNKAQIERSKNQTGQHSLGQQWAQSAAEARHRKSGLVFDGSCVDINTEVTSLHIVIGLPLGLMFEENDNGCNVRNVNRSYDAIEETICAGDQLTYVNEHKITGGLSVNEIATIIRSSPDCSQIKLVFLRYTGPNKWIRRIKSDSPLPFDEKNVHNNDNLNNVSTETCETVLTSLSIDISMEEERASPTMPFDELDEDDIIFEESIEVKAHPENLETLPDHLLEPALKLETPNKPKNPNTTKSKKGFWGKSDQNGKNNEQKKKKKFALFKRGKSKS